MNACCLLVSAILLSLVLPGFGRMIIDVAPRNCSRNVKIRRTIANMKVSTRKECSRYCDKVDTCVSYQVQSPKQRQCTLLKNQAGRDAHHLMPKKGWTYKEKTTAASMKSDTCKEMYPQCKATIKTFEEVEIIAERGATWGWWGRDFNRTVEQDPRIFWMDNWSNIKRIYWYEDIGHAWADRDRNYFPDLPFGCDGLQHLIYDSKIWCRRYNDRHVNVFDFDKWKMTAEISFDLVDGHVAGYNGQCHLDHGNYRSDMDVEADESGVWVIWARVNENCGLSVSKIDMHTYTISRTFHTNFPRKSIGNPFMICGRMYGIDHYNSYPRYFEFIFDTRTLNYTEHWNAQHEGFVYVPNEHSYLSFTNYNPVDGYIYSYNNIRWHRKKPVFVEGYENDRWRNSP